eukprot:CAMPEP_0204491930 /NCGR_PEP_ID=MMETSP0471-20130131/78441_1 /ASSEMBLY_ACC=CAM_ASM_000602 /TAXON_ID=2969 /ORGANISM="Oxyrrhis marina" /LENGTH=45 /DNA_ID= /DNA_START= /DNA_END= /DNA_ORIENTATION=
MSVQGPRCVPQSGGQGLALRDYRVQGTVVEQLRDLCHNHSVVNQT